MITNIIDSLEQGIPHPSSSSSTAPVNRERLEGPGHTTGVLELFAGTGRWTQAMEKAGLRVFPGFELANGKQYDLLNSEIQDIVLSLIRGKQIWLVHLGTPCTAWSRARHGIRNVAKARYKEQVAVATAIFTCRVIRECLKHGVAFTLENPLSSRLWEFKPIQDILSHKNVFMVVFDHCCYGMPYKKSIGLMTNTPQFKTLGLRCCGGHKHIQLKGTETVTHNGATTTRNRTAGAGAYPIKLCRLWAQISRQIGPSGCRTKMSRWEREAFEQLLHEATHSHDRQDQKHVDVPDHPTWKGEAGCDSKLLTEAKDFIKTHPVVFGQFHQNRTLPESLRPKHKEDIRKATSRKKVRVGLQGKPLPKHLQLRTLKVGQVTLNRYLQCIDQFEEWCKQNRVKTSALFLDRAVTKYITYLYDSDLRTIHCHIYYIWATITAV